MPEHSSDPIRHPQPSGTGATIGVIIIVLLMLVGAIYFLNMRLAERNGASEQLPFIPGDATTTIVSQ